MTKTIPLLLCILLLPVAHAAAQDSTADPAEAAYERIVPRSYCCVRTAMSMHIDGRADEAAWRRALWTADFVDIQGDLRPAPRFRTRVKMLWDDTHFYVYAEMEEPHLWARLRQRDTVIFHDNDFEIFVCPTGSNHTYYEFEVNAYNTVWDLFLAKPYRDGGPADNGWNIDGLRSAVQLRGSINDASDLDDGWSVEVAIPWAAFDRTALRFEGTDIPLAAAAPDAGDVMRVNFSRVEWKLSRAGNAYRKVKGEREDNWVWSPQGVIDMHRPEKWGWVYFTEGLSECAGLGPDPDYSYHMALMQVYWAQKAFQKRYGRFAATLEELRPHAGSLTARDMLPRMRITATGYEASFTVRSSRDATYSISIDERSQILTLEAPQR